MRLHPLRSFLRTIARKALGNTVKGGRLNRAIRKAFRPSSRLFHTTLHLGICNGLHLAVHCKTSPAIIATPLFARSALLCINRQDIGCRGRWISGGQTTHHSLHQHRFFKSVLKTFEVSLGSLGVGARPALHRCDRSEASASSVAIHFAHRHKCGRTIDFAPSFKKQAHLLSGVAPIFPLLKEGLEHVTGILRP